MSERLVLGGSEGVFVERTWNGQKQREIQDQIVLYFRTSQGPDCQENLPQVKGAHVNLRKEKSKSRGQNEGEALKQEWLGCRTFGMARTEVVFISCCLYGALWNLSGSKVRMVPGFPKNKNIKQNIRRSCGSISTHFLKLSHL